MSSHNSESPMSMSFAATSHEQFREIVRRAEDREKTRIDAPLPIAREALARRWKVSTGTLQNLRRGRLKGLSAMVRDRITAARLLDIDADIGRLEHEKQLLLQVGASVGGNEILEIETLLAKARAAIDAVRK